MTSQARYKALITFAATDHPDMTPEQITAHIASETEALEQDDYFPYASREAAERKGGITTKHIREYTR